MSSNKQEMDEKLCDGNCLQQGLQRKAFPGDAMSRDLTWWRITNCACKLTSCPNHLLCNNALPNHLIKCYGGRCLNCDMKFYANVVFTNEDECPVCFEVKDNVVKLPKCGHKICVECTREIMVVTFGPNPIILESKEEQDKEEMESNIAYESYCQKHPNDSDSEEEQEEDLSPKKKCPLCRDDNAPSWSKGKISK